MCFHFLAHPLIEEPSTSVKYRTAHFTSLYQSIPERHSGTGQSFWGCEPTTSSHPLISFGYQVLQFGVNKGKAGKRLLVHGVNEHLVAVGQPRLLVQELSVKVAAVAGGFLGRKGPGLQSGRDSKSHCAVVDKQS